MNIRLKITILLLLAGGTLGSARLAAQQRQRSFDVVKRSDARLVSENAAWLDALPDIRISEARLFVEKNNGRFVNYFQSPDSRTAGAGTESFFRVNRRLVFYGRVSYRNFTGKRMGGSAFIEPLSAPFDLAESTDTTRGTKQLEVYRLAGSIAYNLSKRITVGAKTDYSAANYTKRKDLRHTNKLLDFETTLGIKYKPNKKTEIGLNAFYRKRVEGIYFKTYGTTDKQYVSLIDFGSSYGRTELYTDNGDGYTSGKTERPLTDNYYGGAAQFRVSFSLPFSLFNQLYYRSRSGYYGIQSASGVVYTEHKGQGWGYLGSALFTKSTDRHRLDVNFESEALQNFENVYTIENEPGGFSYVTYHDKNKMQERHREKIRMEYIGNIGSENGLPLWVVKASACIGRQYRKTSIYPFFRKQELTCWRTNGSATRNLFRGQRHCFGLTLGLSYGGGDGTPFSDGLYAEPSATEKPPKTADFNLYSEHDYLTATRWGVHPALRYTMLFKGGNTGSISLKYDYLQAVRTNSGNRNHQQLQLAFGVGF